MVIVKNTEKGGPKSYPGLKETEMPAGSPLMVAVGFSLSKESLETVGIRVEDRVPPMPAVTWPDVAVRVRLVTSSLEGGGGAVDDVDVVVELVDVTEVLVVEVVVDVVEEVEAVVEVLVDVDEEVEPEGSSANPISIQG
jgi:hypothetical protein